MASPQPLQTASPQTTGESSVLVKPFTFVKRAVMGTTYGTIFLAKHVKEMLKDDLHIDLRLETFPKEVSRDLKSLENLSSYLRWVRGILCILGIASFVLSILVIEMNTVQLSWAILAVSIVAEIVLVRVYMVKATIAGLTNPIYRGKSSLWFSPHFYQMITEMVFWLIQCPPTLEDVYPYSMLGFFVFARLYSLIMYVNNATLVYRTFCRAMSAMVGVPLSNSFFLRTSLIYYKAKTAAIVVPSLWLTLALMFSKSEDHDYRDSIWFIFVTVGTIGYGDFSPVTALGRLTAFLAWVFALVGIGYVVVLTHDTLQLRDHERNLYLLFRSNELKGTIREQAVLTIQASWKFYLCKKRNGFIMERNYFAWELAEQALKMKEFRRTIREAERLFRQNSKEIELQAVAALKLSAQYESEFPMTQRSYVDPTAMRVTSPKTKRFPSPKMQGPLSVSGGTASPGMVTDSCELQLKVVLLEARVAKLSSLLASLIAADVEKSDGSSS